MGAAFKRIQTAYGWSFFHSPQIWRLLWRPGQRASEFPILVVLRVSEPHGRRECSARPYACVYACTMQCRAAAGVLREPCPRYRYARDTPAAGPRGNARAGLNF